MTVTDAIAQQLQHDGYAVIPRLMSQEAVTTARAELGALLDDVPWGSGFDGTRTMPRSGSYRSAYRNSSASTSRPLTSASLTAVTPASG